MGERLRGSAVGLREMPSLTLGPLRVGGAIGLMAALSAACTTQGEDEPSTADAADAVPAAAAAAAADAAPAEQQGSGGAAELGSAQSPGAAVGAGAELLDAGGPRPGPSSLDSSAPTGSVAESGACRGAALSCDALGSLECFDALGCMAIGTCQALGEARPCDEHDEQRSCIGAPGCVWSAEAESCTGELRSCAEIETPKACLAFLDCLWLTEQCSGEAEPCDGLSAAACALQPGCSLDAGDSVEELSGSPMSEGGSAVGEDSGSGSPDAGIEEPPGGDAGTLGEDVLPPVADDPGEGVDSGVDVGAGVAQMIDNPQLAPFQPEDCTLIAASEPYTAISGAASLSVQSDGATTACLFTEPDRACVYGVVAEAMWDYSNWGAYLSVQLAELGADGVLIAPFDADELGIAGFSMRLDGAGEQAAVRVGLSMVDNPSGSAAFRNYEQNPFWLSGGASADFDVSVRVALRFDEFSQADWTSLDVGGDGQSDVDARLDTSRVHSLTFHIVSKMNQALPYNVCLGEFQWLDAQGIPVRFR